MLKAKVEIGSPNTPRVVCNEYSDDCIFREKGICKYDEGTKRCANPQELMEIEELKRRPNKRRMGALKIILALSN